MINIFDKLYYILSNDNFILRCLRYLVRVSANLYAKYMMPVNSKSCIEDNDTVIVSLTSFPARISNVWITIATLLNQDYDNMKVILWLSGEEFPSKENLPAKLLALQQKGLDIQIVPDNLKPHKKYFYAMRKYPNNTLITVDDDILYRSDLISSLVKAHEKFPGCVICNRGVNIGEDAYVSWKHTDGKQASVPSHRIMPTGIGGVLYAPGCYDNKYIFDIDVIKRTCLNGDDLWLNFMTRSIGTKVVLTGFKTGLVTLLTSQSSALCNNNVGQNKNDAQIAAINEWANRELGISFYDKIEINEN